MDAKPQPRTILFGRLTLDPVVWRGRVRKAIVAGAVLALLGIIGTIGAIEYTARPQFCASCHNMIPYYESWEHSTHNHVPCTDCHFEPGLLETLYGKFKASTHVAKYVTGTAGTKPWAEVSDESCMRSNCHSRRLLEGEIPFKRVRFDHREHLLEMRRGKRIRCTTCHSQIVQGDHMNVTESVCFICHFYTGGDTEPPTDCNACHGPPMDDIAVDEVTFRHSDYIRRGVACLDCHADVTRGSGQVRRERCHTCHDEVAHIERIGEIEYMHQLHVTDNKVECFDCHDEIAHALAEPRHREAGKDCTACHGASHSAQGLLFRGQGGAGVPALADPMFQTHVSCEACHRFPAGVKQNPFLHRPAPATEVGCMHCHGPEFGKMAGRWHEAVSAAEDLLERGREAAEKRVEAGAALDGKGAQGLAAAGTNLDLLRADGSHGVHNIRYSWRLLHAARRGLKDAFEALGDDAPDLEIGPEPVSRHRCAETCHMDLGFRTLPYGKSGFPHANHYKNAGDCEECHDVVNHGVTRVQPAQCTQCHHERDPGKRPCADCHDETVRFASGTGPGSWAEKSDMAPGDVGCADCHAADAIGKPDQRAKLRASCVDCHDEEYGPMLDTWIRERDEGLEALQAALASGALPPAEKARLEEDLRFLRRAGAVHNMPLARKMFARR